VATRQELDDAIRGAREAGVSLRDIAKEAGLSPEWVRRIASR
jgi:AcrR family transcriptional regulator